MEAFLSRKRRRLSPTIAPDRRVPSLGRSNSRSSEDDSTELKLAVLASLHPYLDQSLLLDLLLSNDGSVDAVTEALTSSAAEGSPRKNPQLARLGYQASLKSFGVKGPESASKQLTRKGRTLHLYSPEDVAAHTPCSIIHNFLPPEQANDLLLELLNESCTFEKQTFKLFDNVVQSPHTACFYVQNSEQQRKQKTEYLYNGSYLTDVRQITPQMRSVSAIVQTAVNEEIATRIKTKYPNGKKLRFQSPKEWKPNAAFVNCYNGGAESVGYHSDQLTYLGPRAVIGSLSLGVAREFRVRKVVPREDDAPNDGARSGNVNDDPRADAEGQIAIHLPHNSLLVMHAEMQEEWKHSIAPAQAIDPHPVAGNRRINVTYRYYPDIFHPRYTVRCKCGVPTVLRCVQRKKENWGRYFWMCHAGLVPGKEGCTFFQWAEFDDDGEPPWAKDNDNQALNQTRADNVNDEGGLSTIKFTQVSLPQMETSPDLPQLPHVPEDTIAECGQGWLSLLSCPARLDEVIHFAHTQLHVYPFNEVPLHYRRLYTDASILKAIHTSTTEPLDRAIILTGAPGRREYIENIFEQWEIPASEWNIASFPQGEELPDLSHPIARVPEISMSSFSKLTMPTIISGALEWPALERWTPSYLIEKTFGGRRLVPVETGRSYTDAGWGQTIIPFGKFLRDYIVSDKMGYLAQHDLFAQIPSLRKDISIPDYCYTTESDADPLLNAWFGPKGTVSPLHHDPYENVLCQVVGKKYVRLYAPDQTGKVYPRGVEETGVDMSNTSQVDVEGDTTEFPLFSDARYVEGILHEGDCLYIPKGWWHYVRSLSVSFSVSFWYS